MSNRTRTITWMEDKLLEVLTKRGIITTYLGLCYCVLHDVRSIQEQHNLDMAVTNLLSQQKITKCKDEDGFAEYRLAG